MWQRGMLAQLAARLRARQAGRGDGDAEDEGGPVVVDDDCLVSTVDICCVRLGTNASRSSCEETIWMIRRRLWG